MKAPTEQSSSCTSDYSVLIDQRQSEPRQPMRNDSKMKQQRTLGQTIDQQSSTDRINMKRNYSLKSETIYHYVIKTFAGAELPKLTCSHRQAQRDGILKLIAKAKPGLLVGIISGLLLFQNAVQSFPFQNNTASVQHWFNTRKYSNDPTLKVRVRNIYDCEMSRNRTPETEWTIIESLQCKGYADYIDGEHPSGTTCKVHLIYNRSQNGSIDARIIPWNKFCFRSLDWI